MGKARNITISASKHAAVIAACAATLIVGKFALSFIPNIEVVTTLVTVYAFVFGFDCLGATVVFCFADLILYPPSPDVAISYFIYWNLLALIVALMSRKIKSEYVYLIAALVMTALFGVLTTLMSHLIIGLPFAVTYLAGIPFYVMQIVSTLVFMSVGFKPLTKVLVKLRDGLFKR